MPRSAGGHKAACSPQVRAQTSLRQRFCVGKLRKWAKPAKNAGLTRVAAGVERALGRHREVKTGLRWRMGGLVVGRRGPFHFCGQPPGSEAGLPCQPGSQPGIPDYSPVAMALTLTYWYLYIDGDWKAAPMAWFVAQRRAFISARCPPSIGRPTPPSPARLGPAGLEAAPDRRAGGPRNQDPHGARASSSVRCHLFGGDLRGARIREAGEEDGHP
jgi:hypothetical protein